MQYALFSDADGTLLHRVGGPDAITIDGVSYIAGKALQLIEDYRRGGNLFSVTTGRRVGSRESLSGLLNPDELIMEHGCAIFSGGVLDRAWIENLRYEIGEPWERRGILWYLEGELRSAGYVTDSDGRIGSFRLGIGSSYHLSDGQRDEADFLIKRLAGGSITTTLNQGMLDVIPIKGGKENAMAYVVDKRKIGKKAVLVLCDDHNDEGIATSGYWVACPSHAPEAIKDIVRPKGYVSGFTLHEGTIDMLERVVRLTLR